MQRHRASSAIEGFNAALRPYLYVHKGVTQGFLELFRAYFNLRHSPLGASQGHQRSSVPERQARRGLARGAGLSALHRADLAAGASRPLSYYPNSKPSAQRGWGRTRSHL